jgi:EAL domain-containing protein (putative c-di-GMP-specific phosphodiesterase class I)
MFWAKRRPGVRVAVFDESMAEEADRRSLLLAQLPGAVERGELSLVFQPLYRLDAGTVAAAEALLRWRHPLFGDVTPSEFVPLAEESGDIREIGAWVLESAVAQVAAWRRVGRLLPRLLVNTSAAQFTDDLPDQVAVLLARHEVPPEQLVLEITESQLPGLAANTAIPRLRDGGVRIARDDFGSGYSSLAQLARLPVDLLKVDRDFITNLSEASGRYVLDAVVALARSLGLETVAEGIEEDWQATEVAGSGVDYGQGFLFARPLTAEEMIARLEVPTVVRPRRPDTSPTVRSGSD